MDTGKTSQKKSIMVSIFCMVYNHEPYIRKCLEGFLMQECDFDYQIVLGEDCSTDNSRAIILEYADKYPTRFKLLLHENNVGAAENQRIVFENCKGKYIAMCEGDDYWTDPLKLQKQVDFLEANPDYVFSVGRVNILFEETKKIIQKKELVNPAKLETYYIKDYLKFPFSQTSTFVFRNSNIPFPDWIQNVHAGDQSIVVIKTSNNGKIKFHNDVFSIYRINKGSVTFNAEYDVFLKHIETQNEWEAYLNNRKFDKIFIILKYRYKLYSKYNKTNLFLLKGLIIVNLKIIDLILKIL